MKYKPPDALQLMKNVTEQTVEMRLKYALEQYTQLRTKYFEVLAEVKKSKVEEAIDYLNEKLAETWSEEITSSSLFQLNPEHQDFFDLVWSLVEGQNYFPENIRNETFTLLSEDYQTLAQFLYKNLDTKNKVSLQGLLENIVDNKTDEEWQAILDEWVMALEQNLITIR